MSKISLVISNFDGRPSIKKLLNKLRGHDITIFCYDCNVNSDYPVFFINYILNANDSIYISCDKLAKNKCDKFKRNHQYIDIDSPDTDLEKINVA